MYRNVTKGRNSIIVRIKKGYPLLYERMSVKPWTLLFLKWSRFNFSLRYQYTVKQTGDENKGSHQGWRHVRCPDSVYSSLYTCSVGFVLRHLKRNKDSCGWEYVWARGRDSYIQVTGMIVVQIWQELLVFLEMVPVRGENEFEPRPQNEILVPFRGSLQNFRRSSPSLLYGSPPLGGVGRGRRLQVSSHI